VGASWSRPRSRSTGAISARPTTAPENQPHRSVEEHVTEPRPPNAPAPSQRVAEFLGVRVENTSESGSSTSSSSEEEEEEEELPPPVRLGGGLIGDQVTQLALRVAQHYEVKFSDCGGHGVRARVVPIADKFECPITRDFMKDPVMTCDGHIYEWSAIERWFQQGRRTSPLTNCRLQSLECIPVTPLRRAIEAFLNSKPEVLGLCRGQVKEVKALNATVEALQRELQKKQEQLESTQAEIANLRQSLEEAQHLPHGSPVKEADQQPQCRRSSRRCAHKSATIAGLEDEAACEQASSMSPARRQVRIRRSCGPRRLVNGNSPKPRRRNRAASSSQVRWPEENATMLPPPPLPVPPSPAAAPPALAPSSESSSALRAQPAQEALKREDLTRIVFCELDSEGCGRLRQQQLRRFVHACGFGGSSSEDWTAQFRLLCARYDFNESTGMGLDEFARMVSDDGGCMQCSRKDLARARKVLTRGPAPDFVWPARDVMLP